MITSIIIACDSVGNQKIVGVVVVVVVVVKSDRENGIVVMGGSDAREHWKDLSF